MQNQIICTAGSNSYYNMRHSVLLIEQNEKVQY